MFWSDNDTVDTNNESSIIVDVSVQLSCKQLPGDHIYDLTSEILRILPTIADIPNIAIHQIYIPSSGNGWQRQEHSSDNLLHLSKRTKLIIRLPIKFIDQIKQLTGKQINVSGYPLTFGTVKVKKIQASEILVSRYAYFPDTESDEEKFLELAFKELKQKNVVIKKMLCGKSTHFNIMGKLIKTRSLMIADLNSEDSLAIQETGIGLYNLYGCGIFIPQKGIKAVNQE